MTVLFPEQVKQDGPSVGGGTVLKNIDALPCSEAETALLHGNRELRQGEGGTDMCGHIVRPLDGVAVEAVVLGHEAAEEDVQVVDHVRVGVLLDGEGRRSVLNKHS